MKPAPFDYIRPNTLEEACAVLAANPEAIVIAGGQTLTPMLAMRLARPSLLVDIHRLAELRGIRQSADGLQIGAATRQAEAEESVLVARLVPLLAAALPWVGHRPTRTRGTIGGSLANADPAAEIGLVAVTLDATLSWRDATTQGSIKARSFFQGPMQTALPARACLTGVTFPIWPEATIGVAFQEISSRRSDFALVSAACQVAIDGQGLCRRVALGIGGAAAAPVALAVDGLVGTRLTEDAVRNAVSTATASLACMEDPHVSAAYRMRGARELGARAVLEAGKNAAASLGVSA